MFTFRAERHAADPAVPAPSDYYMVQAQVYEVTRQRAEDRAEIRLGSREDLFPDGLYLYVGPKEMFGVVYVMNPAGKTIDTIR